MASTFNSYVLHISDVIKVKIDREQETVYYCAESGKVSTQKFKQDVVADFKLSLNKNTKVKWWFSNKLAYDDSLFESTLKLLSSRCE